MRSQEESRKEARVMRGTCAPRFLVSCQPQGKTPPSDDSHVGGKLLDGLLVSRDAEKGVAISSGCVHDRFSERDKC